MRNEIADLVRRKQEENLSDKEIPLYMPEYLEARSKIAEVEKKLEENKTYDKMTGRVSDEREEIF
jgi:23S rRNA maturation-related 3'-5' exoribonuclease YhaM